ncbi:oligomeric, coiled-coil, peripheral membrane protein, partial [Rhizophlyctis rosea]
MKVYQAESGMLLPTRSFQPSETLDDLREEIRTLTGIPPTAQILLTAKGFQLKPSMFTDALKDGTDKDDHTIFVFNRQYLDSRSGSASQSQVTPIRILVEPEPPIPLEVLAQVDHIPRLPTIVEQCTAYVAAFKSHVSYGQAMSKTARNHLSMCERLLQEQKTQMESLGIALTNLGAHSRSVITAFDSYNAQAQKEFVKHGNLLQSFPSDLQALHRIPVHPSIAPDNRFLSDYVPEEKLRVWAEGCRSAHEQLVQKTQKMADRVKGIRSGTEGVGSGVGVDFPKLESLLQSARECVGKIEGREQVLGRDLTRVQTTLTSTPPTTTPTEKLTAVHHLLAIHREEYLPDLLSLDSHIRTTLSHFISSKKELTVDLLARLNSISYLQSGIVEVQEGLKGVAGQLRSCQGAFGQLLHVHRMPVAWGAGVVEVVRRREFGKFYLQKAQEVASVLQAFRSVEEKRRENFRKEIERYLPNGLIRGLDEAPVVVE